MKNIILLALSLIWINLVSIAQEENQAIRDVIQSAYIDGIHNRQGLEKIHKGFHPGFEMISKRNGLLTKLPIYNWIETVERAMMDQKEPEEQNFVTAKFPMIDISGDAAVAKVELYRDDVHLFTDYMFLYRFGNDWRIVSKIYYRQAE